MAAIRITVKGRVQGVNYRWFAKQVADNLGVKGWIRNLENGDVDVFAEGAGYKLGLFAEGLRKGPIDSKVDTLDIKKVEEEEHESFEIM